MKKEIGLIIDKYHLEKKVRKFLSYMNKICNLSIYIEENHLLDFNNINFNEDLFFIKGKGDGILNFAKLIERETNIPVINSSKGIWLAYNRFMNSTVLRSANIRVPNFSLNPKEEKPPFKAFIIKNVRDQDNYAFDPNIKIADHNLEVRDERAIEEVYGTNPQYNFFYYQEYIESEFEYKIYGIGEQLFYYKQKPILREPDKMKSRVTIEPIVELGEIAYKVMELFNLKITSLDFLKSTEGVYYLTDVNSTPNFNYIKNGWEIVGNYLLSQTK
jgi:glutathione synthase/RimK-type ligase-like ATP-grasp enzyme